MRRIFPFSAALAAFIGLAACSGDATNMLSPESSQGLLTTTGTVASITINPLAPIALGSGGIKQLVVVARTAVGDTVTGLTYTYTSSNPTVVAVSPQGLVLGKTVGTATITATHGTVSGSTIVTAGTSTSVVIPPSRIAVSLAASSLSSGATTQASAIAYNASNAVVSGTTFTWTTASSAIATVSSSGLVTAVGAGTTTITATSGSTSGTATLTVTAAATVPPSGAVTLPASYETFAALPQQYVNTAMPAAPAAGHQIIPVATAAALQSALNSATYGDVIELQSGATFIGNFTLPAKGANNGLWITIRPSSAAGLPAPGARMTPTVAAAANLPIILSPNQMGAITTALGAHHYRLIGLEVSRTATAGANTGLVRLGNDGSAGQTSLSVVAHDLVVDRAYIHGTPSTSTRRGVSLNSAMTAVVDSYIGDCHEKGADAQAIWGYNGPGPFKIVNNYLEGSGENVMFGGSDPAITNLVPSDIEIRGNHFFKPLAWKGVWTVKNLFESKNSMRVLVEGNIFEGNWLDAQTGSAISIKVANQGGSCTWCTTQDMTFRYNIIRNVGSGFVLSGSDPGVSVHAKRVTVTDNLMYNINTSSYNGVGRGATVSDDPTDFTVAHNTIFAPDQYAIFFAGPNSPAPVRFSIRDNVIGGGVYGVKGSGLAAGTTTITTFMAASSFAANVINLTSSSAYPTGNFYPTSGSAIGFLNSAANDYHLSASSPYKGKGTDKRDPGADIDGILSRTSGVIVP